MSNEVNEQVGRRIRHLRWKGGKSQDDLAKDIGLSVEQVKRFEDGTERVNAHHLWRISGVFRVPIAHFYEAKVEEDPDILALAEALTDFVLNREAADLVEAYGTLSVAERRRVWAAAKVTRH